LIRISAFTPKKNTISYIYSIKDKIEIAPPYQRHGNLWNDETKQQFLDSIFNDYDIPKIYLHMLEMPKTKQGGKIVLYAIIDGRQRLETIWSFIDGKLELGDYELYRLKTPINLKGQTYKELSANYPSLKTFFDNYELPLIFVKTNLDDDDLIDDMFSRLNQGVSPTSAERRNAKGGKIVKLIRKLAKHEFFKDKVTISNKRYQHFEVAVRLLFLENSIRKGEIIDTKRTKLDNFVIEYKKNSPEPGTIEMVFTILDTMCRIFSSKDRLLSRQARIPIYYLLTREAKNQNLLRNITREGIKEFNNKVEQNKKLALTNIDLAKPSLVRYDRWSIQGTNDASSIKGRFDIISKNFKINSDRISHL